MGWDKSTIAVDFLEQSMQPVRQLRELTADGKQLLTKAELLLGLRKALIDSRWADVEDIVAQSMQLDIATPEVQAARDKLKYRVEVDACTAQLDSAIMAVDTTLLHAARQEAYRLTILELREACDACKIAAPLVEEVDRLLPKLEDLDARLGRHIHEVQSSGDKRRNLPGLGSGPAAVCVE